MSNSKITFKTITVNKENFLAVINPDQQINEYDGLLYYNTGIYGSKNDNAFPQFLLDLYTNATSVHSNFINLKGNLILGNNLQAEDDTQASIINPFLMRYNKSGDNLKSVYAKASMDMALFESVVLQCVFNREGKVAEIYHIPTQNFRLGKLNKYGWSEFGYISNNFGYISNSTYHSNMMQTKDAVKIRMWDPSAWKKYPVQLMYLKPYSYSPYAIPSYNAGLNWILVSHEISEFHRNNLKTNLFLSGILTQIKGGMSDEQIEENANEIEKFYAGSKGRKVLISYVDSMDSKPTFDSITGAEQDALFDVLQKESFTQIVAAHGGFPILSGVDQGASLGGEANTINIALQAFTKLKTDNFKQVLLDGINRVTQVNELPPVTCITEPLKITQPIPQNDDLTRNERRAFLYDLPEIDESQNNVTSSNNLPA